MTSCRQSGFTVKKALIKTPVDMFLFCCRRPQLSDMQQREEKTVISVDHNSNGETRWSEKTLSNQHSTHSPVAEETSSSLDRPICGELEQKEPSSSKNLDGPVVAYQEDLDNKDLDSTKETRHKYKGHKSLESAAKTTEKHREQQDLESIQETTDRFQEHMKLTSVEETRDKHSEHENLKFKEDLEDEDLHLKGGTEDEDLLFIDNVVESYFKSMDRSEDDCFRSLTDSKCMGFVSKRNPKNFPFLKSLLYRVSFNKRRDWANRCSMDLFGFPNIGQTCYMNSSLQSLLTLHGFINSVNTMQNIWNSVPNTEILRQLHKMRELRTSRDKATTHFLHSFKEVVSLQDPEFADNEQKDAHQFLTSVLNQVHCLAPQLQLTATMLDRSYVCPVEDQVMFKMENIRTCSRCGNQSRLLEDFTNLSVDLVPECTTEGLLQNFMREVEVEFNCDCGGDTSSRMSTFATLPKVLILHLKRLLYTPFYEVEKVHDHVTLQQDIVVSSSEGIGHYGLVSVISHFGNAYSGHYICEGVHPDQGQGECWLTYNDSTVRETTTSSVCEQRKGSAYVLFYKRQMCEGETVTGCC